MLQGETSDLTMAQRTCSRLHRQRYLVRKPERAVETISFSTAWILKGLRVLVKNRRGRDHRYLSSPKRVAR